MARMTADAQVMEAARDRSLTAEWLAAPDMTIEEAAREASEILNTEEDSRTRANRLSARMMYAKGEDAKNLFYGALIGLGYRFR